MKYVQVVVLLLFTGSAHSQLRDTAISIYFENNSYQIDVGDRNELKSILNQNSQVLSLTGFADSVGSSKSNSVLVENRLRSVINLLNELDIDLKAVQIINGGEETLNYLSLALSRRVDIKMRVKNINANNGSIDKELIGIQIRKFNFLNHFQFEPDKAVLTVGSYPYVDELYNLLKTNEFELEIVGHVNYQSKRDKTYLQSLYDLSANRARVIYDLLLERGIQVNRMKYSGVGNSEPIIPNPKTDEEKRKNMRVEIKIISIH
jgi:outer membrane protein OmpA-like peptidoglycan-associated protein